MSVVRVSLSKPREQLLKKFFMEVSIRIIKNASTKQLCLSLGLGKPNRSNFDSKIVFRV